jgi:WD40 repeat protein
MRRVRTSTVLSAVLMSVALMACGGDTVEIAVGGQPTHQKVVYNDPLFTLETTPDWVKVSEFGADPRAVVFNSGQGHIATIWIWPQESRQYSGFSADVAWRLDWIDPDRTRLKVVEESPLCDPTPLGQTQFCSAGDGKLQVYAKTNFDSAFSAGHQFQFEFGYLAGEELSQSHVFQDVLTGFSVKTSAENQTGR